MLPRRLRPAGCGIVAAAPFALAALVVWALAAAPALAQDDPQRVEITAPAPLRMNVPAAGPVTVLRAADLARAGVTTAAQALQYLASQQRTKGVAQAVGSASGGVAEADLRGLGEENTLVLLDGRRLAAHPYHGAAVDLNAIPLAAIDRIEVRRDAGVVLQGSGAVAGVVDFILRRDVDGLSLVAEAEQPRRRGGASARASLVGGRGVLVRDGFAWTLAADLRQQQAITATQRSFTRSGIVRAADGAVSRAVTSPTSFPGDLDGFEPSLAAGCAPPRSLPDPGGGASCRYDELPETDLVPRNRQATLLADAAWAGPADTTLRAQWMHAEQRVRSAIAPTPVTALLPLASPYWIAGRPARSFEGQPDGGIADFRLVEVGRRVDETRSIAQRALLGAQTKLEAWELDATLLHSSGRVDDRLADGHVDLSRVRQGLLDGVIDPFGAPDAAGRAALDAARLRGPLADARSALLMLDLRAVWRLGGGAGTPLQHRVLLLAQLARERFAFDVHPNAERAAANELEQADDTHGARGTQALAVAWTAQVGSAFDATLGARVDHIEPGLRRTSPWLGLRWRAAPELLWRASAGSGFRAPTLYEINAPARLARSNALLDDPRGGPEAHAGPGGPRAALCGARPLLRSGGPASAGRDASSLAAETGRTATLGWLAESGPGTTLSADLWWARLRGGIGALSADTVFGDPVRHGARLARCGSLDAATRATIADCAPYPTFDPIAWVGVSNENLIDTDARGVDLALAWRGVHGALGELALALDATYVARQRTRIGRDGQFFASVGRFAADKPVFRLQTVAQATWSRAAWTASLTQRRRSGYVDQSGTRRVQAYELVDAALAHELEAGLTLGVGVKNLFDRAPPFSDQTETPQANYDPRFADPTGRTLTLRLAWEWR